MLSRTHTVSRISLQTKLEALARAGAELYEAADRGDPMELREVQQAAELHQQYIDVLEEMENSPLNMGEWITVETDGQPIRFKNIDRLADWLAEVMD